MYDELISALREDAEWAEANEWETPITLSDHLKQAADAIEELVGFVQEAERDRDEYRERLDKANDAIEELTADLERSKEWETFWEKEANEALKKFQTTVANKPRWIPVTERLPEDGQHALVMRYDYVTNTPFYDLLWLDSGKWWNRQFPGDYSVTHWMPLPEPPKEG